MAALRHIAVSSTPSRYVTAVLAAIGASLLKLGFARVFGPGLPYLLVYPAVMLTAILGGFGPGLLASVISALLTALWTLPRERGFAPMSARDAVGLAVFTGMGVFMSALAGLYHHARERLEEVETKRAVRDSEERFRAFFDNPGVGTVQLDLQGRFQQVNDRYCEITGYSRSELLGMTAPELSLPDEREREREDIAQLARGAEPVVAGERRYLRKDGSLVWVHVTAGIIRDASRRPVGSARIVEDITERKRAEDALREEDRNKAEFLGVLSHELRNPLAPIRNGIYLLEHVPSDSDRAVRAREVIRRQTDHLTRLVDDLLDVTRISRGKIELHRSVVDAREIVRRTCEDHRSLFDQRGIELRLDVAGPAWIDADAARISQVVGNLLHNAAKFTSEGGTAMVNVATAGANAEIRVRDDGIGIEPDQVDRMFEPFAQAERGLARTQGGLGLGLALVKGLVELHGGSVRAYSEGANRGAEFIVRLPLSTAPRERVGGTPEPRATAGRRVLIVEDNVDAGRSLAEVLELSGHEAHLATDGRTGIRKARELRPDVVLCDIGLPDVDGYEIARVLRADETLRSTYLVALSGYAQPEDRARALDAGFDAHLAKPPPLEKLEELLTNAK